MGEGDPRTAGVRQASRTASQDLSSNSEGAEKEISKKIK